MVDTFELERCLRVGRLAAREFADAVRREWRSRHVILRLYGSYARGDAGPDSDVDVLILVEKVNPEDRDRAAHLAFRIGLLKHGVVISALLLSKKQFEDLLNRERALALTIRNEGQEL
jgi:uncharacterized protein